MFIFENIITRYNLIIILRFRTDIMAVGVYRIWYYPYHYVKTN